MQSSVCLPRETHFQLRSPLFLAILTGFRRIKWPSACEAEHSKVCVCGSSSSCVGKGIRGLTCRLCSGWAPAATREDGGYPWPLHLHLEVRVWQLGSSGEG
ncbi:uncharacterized protein LOC122242909 isoform X2 [Penaeus japonicus]|uniref:uncharacterized protein LOC122242909 isoform X2 n=1 Tax=Penaeus japonicus TaxID=27405 RepID=UPI001C711F59|nr:uncharacterized protein LOC122242909 isoform X2 [Penaeus japonicus]